MAIKVIKESWSHIKQISCPNCRSVLEYSDSQDVKLFIVPMSVILIGGSNYYYIDCPVCKNSYKNLKI